MTWTWRPLSDPVLNDLLLAPMRALENALGMIDKYLPGQSVIRTTDATVTVLHTVTVPVNTTLAASGYVVGRRAGGSGGSTNDGAGYRVEFCAKNTAGTAALIGAGSVTVLGESQAGWDCTLVASGGTVLVKVTGAANNDVVWVWSGKMLSATT